MKFSQYNIITPQNDNEILLYNSLTKAALVVNKQFKIEALYSLHEFFELPEEFQNIFIENGFVVEDDFDEYAYLNYAYTRNYFDNQKLSIILVPSMACNFSCPYCFEKGQNQFSDNIASYFNALKQFAIREFKKRKIVSLNLFGGEPLLFINKFFDFFDFLESDSIANGYNYNINITTNGSLLTSDIISRLLKYPVSSLQITVEGSIQQHNKLRAFKDGKESFNLLISNIKHLISVIPPNFTFCLRINILNNTLFEIREILNNFSTSFRKKISILFRMVYNTNEFNEINHNNPAILKPFYDLAQTMGYVIFKQHNSLQSCEACGDINTFFLMPDLTIWKCINDMTFKESKIGKMDLDGTIIFNPDMLATWFHFANFNNSNQCKKCSKLPDCLGGCILMHLKYGERQCRPFDMICLPYFYK